MNNISAGVILLLHLNIWGLSIMIHDSRVIVQPLASGPRPFFGRKNGLVQSVHACANKSVK